MVTVDSTVSKVLRNNPLDKELVLKVDNTAITSLFKTAMNNAAKGERSIIYVHTRHETKPYFLRSALTGGYDITCDVYLTPRLNTMYARRLDVWIDRKNRVVICSDSGEGGINE